MALTDFDYLATRNEIIEAAFRIVGVLEIGQTMSADMLNQGVKALQLLVKSWNNKHLYLWRFDQDTFPTVVGTTSYTPTTFTQRIIGLDKAWVQDSNEDIPLEVISYSRYWDIPDKTTATGRPTHIAYRPSLNPSYTSSEPSFYVYPKPDAVYNINILCPVALKDFDTAAGSGDIPVEFQRALKYGLAEDLFDEYPGPMNERQFVQGKAAELFREAKNFNMPVETTNEVEGLFSIRRC